MSMTHYMELLATNQPWNLILFMAIPVVLAEIVAITELFILFGKVTTGPLKLVNRTAGILVGLYFIGVFFYLLFNAFIPLTATGGWRGPADFIAVSFYLLGVVPLGGIALLELGLLFPKAEAEKKMFIHAVFVGIFLAVAHIAMIIGMLDPNVLNFAPAAAAHTGMPGM